MQQGVPLFTDARHANFRTPAAHRALQLFKDIRTRDLTTQNQDYSAAVVSFLNGGGGGFLVGTRRSEEHTSELKSLMRISYAVFCLTTTKTTWKNVKHTYKVYTLY